MAPQGKRPDERQAPRRRRSKQRRRIDDSLTLIPLHRGALVAAMAEFGDDFDVEAFTAAFDSDAPAEINKVQAVHGNFATIVNALATIADNGYAEAVRLNLADELEGGRYERLEQLGVVSAARRSELQALTNMRNRLQHVYPDIRAEEVHSAVRLLHEQLPAIAADLERWLAKLDGAA